MDALLARTRVFKPRVSLASSFGRSPILLLTSVPQVSVSADFYASLLITLEKKACGLQEIAKRTNHHGLAEFAKQLNSTDFAPTLGHLEHLLAFA